MKAVGGSQVAEGFFPPMDSKDGQGFAGSLVVLIQRFSLTFVALVPWGCMNQYSSHEAQPSEPSELETAAPIPLVGPPIPSQQESKVANPNNANPAVSNCIPVAGIKEELPFYLPRQNIVITRFVSPCLPLQGGVGLLPKTQWLAMGFPCTGGGGRIDIKGKYHNPNVVSFVIGPECSMLPTSKDHVQTLAVEQVGMPKDAPLAAFLPFVVQFWEVTGQQDADTGFSVDLRSIPSVEGVWKGFRENHGFGVRLYGRENSWVPGGYFYQVEGSIHQDGRSTFRLQVQSVKKLSDEDTLKVRQRCELLRPARNCGAVF